MVTLTQLNVRLRPTEKIDMTSRFLHHRGNSDITTFNKRLSSKRAARVYVYNAGNSEEVIVRAVGWLHPDQFKQQFAPDYHFYGNNWDETAKHPRITETVDYSIDELAESMKQHGIGRPVVVSEQAHDTYSVDRSDPENPKWNRGPDMPKVIDGHHRVLAASKAGVLIPTYKLDKKHKY